MATMSEKLIETIEKDIQLLKDVIIDPKTLRKEVNMISKRIDDLLPLLSEKKEHLNNLKEDVKSLLD